MSAGSSVAVAATFLWLGMVAAISFLEAPLKFSAPNVTLQIGLGIGRLVFRALNVAELVLVVVIAVAFAVSPPPVAVIVAFVIAVAALACQLLAVRPRLNRRSDRVLAGLNAPRSRGHYVYVGFEVVKATALAVSGILLLSS
ncbi:MAG: hypothetical protein ACRDTN_06250 [Mycobacterium sp.]